MEILHTINLIKSKTNLENVNLDDIEKRKYSIKKQKQ